MSTSATPLSGEEQPAGESSPTAADVIVAPAIAGGFGTPRLSPLGKRIELLRVDRGLSKQGLARSAGTSRQQLWRVMTGKSELTTALCHRLASVLDVDSRTLSSTMLGAPAPLPNGGSQRLSDHVPSPVSLAAYLETSALLVRSLRTLPRGEDGVAIKRALLNAIEERARVARVPIPAWLFRVRARILDGSL